MDFSILHNVRACHKSAIKLVVFNQNPHFIFSLPSLETYSYPTDYVAINPRYGTFLKSIYIGSQTIKIKLSIIYIDHTLKSTKSTQKHKEYYETHMKEETERLNTLVDWYKFKLDEISETPVDSRPRKLS